MAKKMTQEYKQRKFTEAEELLDIENIGMSPVLFTNGGKTNRGYCTLCKEEVDTVSVGQEQRYAGNTGSYIAYVPRCINHQDIRSHVVYMYGSTLTRSIYSVAAKKVSENEMNFYLLKCEFNGSNQGWAVDSVYFICDEPFALQKIDDGRVNKKPNDRFMPRTMYGTFDICVLGEILKMDEMMHKSGLLEILAQIIHQGTGRKMSMHGVTYESKINIVHDHIREESSNVINIKNLMEFIQNYVDGETGIIEKLAKSQFIDLAVKAYSNNSKYSRDPEIMRIKNNGVDSIKDLIEIPINLAVKVMDLLGPSHPPETLLIIKEIYAHIQNSDITYDFLDYILNQEGGLRNVRGTLKDAGYLLEQGYHAKHLMDYLHRADLYQALTLTNALTNLKDYVKMSTDLEIEYDKYPKDLLLKHNLIAREYSYKTDEMTEKNFRREVKKNKDLEYENDKYMIKIPDTPDEVTKEGRDQKHCVASYVKEVARGQCTIAFLREKSDPDKAYYTIEIDRYGGITQIKGKQNESLKSKDAKLFLDKWSKEKRIDTRI